MVICSEQSFSAMAWSCFPARRQVVRVFVGILPTLGYRVVLILVLRVLGCPCPFDLCNYVKINKISYADKKKERR